MMPVHTIGICCMQSTLKIIKLINDVLRYLMKWVMWFGERSRDGEISSSAPLSPSWPFVTSISPVSFLYSLLYHSRTQANTTNLIYHLSAQPPHTPPISHFAHRQRNHNESTLIRRCQPGGRHRYIGCPYPGSIDRQWRAGMEREDGQDPHRRGRGIQQWYV